MLPFTLVDALGWVMIPVVSLTAFLVLCIEQLAVQIENPFGYDANDLPLHSFTCCVEAGPLRQLTVAHLLAAPQLGSLASFRQTRRVLGCSVHSSAEPEPFRSPWGAVVPPYVSA
eukprot:scaffold117322_cov48-Phaeocystis_antarctica.AAC.1